MLQPVTALVTVHMTDEAPIEMPCPVCGQPMIVLHTIWRAFAESLNVFQCKPCGFSTTAEAPPALAAGRVERKPHHARIFNTDNS